MLKMKDIPKVDRPRERFLEKGPDGLSKSELLAILLGSGIRGKNVKKLSEEIIKKFGSQFLDLSIDDLLKIPGIGKAKALQIVAAISLVRRFHAEQENKESIISSALDVVSYNFDLKTKKKEYLIAMHLNARNVLIEKEIVSIGTLDGSLIHPREIFAPALENRSAGIILIHNHPSGDPTPSLQDNVVFEKVIEAGNILGINVVDFVIVAKDGHFSRLEETTQKKYILTNIA